MASYETRVYVGEEDSVNIGNNTTRVHVIFDFRRTDRNYYGYNELSQAFWNIGCHNQNTGNIIFNFNWNIPQNQWQRIGDAWFTLGHNADGTLGIGLSGYVDFGVAPGALGANGSFTCTTVPRYTSITSWQCASVAQTSATFSWATSDNCDFVIASLNDSSRQNVWSGNARNGSFTYTGLSPGTTYRLKAEIRRRDSQLWTTSSNTSFTTLPITTISNNSVNFNIGSNLILHFNNFNNNNSYLQLSVKNDAGAWIQNVAMVGETIKSSSYTWNLSSISNALYSYCKTKNSMEFQIRCGTTIGGKDYSSVITGIMYVVNSNPSFSNYSYSNTDAGISSLLGATTVPTNYGNMQAQISVANKGTAQNSATVSKYVCYVSMNGNLYTSKEVIYNASAQINIDLGAFPDAGTYTISINVVDSRGNQSGQIRKTFSVLPYHAPLFSNLTLSRVNDYEKEVTLNIEAYYSRLLVGTNAVNSSFIIKYRYCEAGGTFPTNYTNLTGFTSVVSGNDMRVTLSNPSSSPFLTILDSGKSYDFEFVAIDKLYHTVNRKLVPQGIAPCTIYEDGTTVINRVPDFKNASKARLQVASDILAQKDGQDIFVLDELDRINYNNYITTNTSQGMPPSPLHIGLDNRYNDYNKNYAMYQPPSPGMQYKNMPTDLEGKECILYRNVMYSTPNHILVTLFEAFPVCGRIWSCFYNCGNWTGWRKTTST